MKALSTPSYERRWTSRTLSTRSTGPASCEVRRVASGLHRYCDLCHSNDSFVLFGPEKSRAKGGTTGRPSGTLLFALGLHRAFHKEELTLKRSTTHWTWRPFTSPRDATQALLAGFQKGLDDRGLQLNPVKSKQTQAKPLHPDIHPSEPRQDWRFDTTNASLVKALELLLPQTLMTQLVRLQSLPPPSSSFASASAHARDSLFLLRYTGASLPQALLWSASSSRMTPPRSGSDQEGWPGHQGPRPPLTSRLPGIQQQRRLCDNQWDSFCATSDTHGGRRHATSHRAPAWQPGGLVYSQQFLSDALTLEWHPEGKSRHVDLQHAWVLGMLTSGRIKTLFIEK